MNQEVFSALNDALQRGDEVALVTIVSSTGSTPQRVGAKMLVYADGRTVGTIGGGCYENEAFWKAREAIKSRKPIKLKFDLNDDFAQETGLVCGGQMEVFVEPVEPSPELYVFGAGHVGAAIARAAGAAGFRVIVIDDRAEYADPSRFPDGVDVLAADVEAALTRYPLMAADAVVIATRGHRNDALILERVATSPAGYVGLLGSRRKKVVVTKGLKAAGVPAKSLQRVRVPVGLAIGAITPEEIAVSVVAELIAWRRGEA